jgi:hypothetical protein
MPAHRVFSVTVKGVVREYAARIDVRARDQAEADKIARRLQRMGESTMSRKSNNRRFGGLSCRRC